MGRKKKQDIKQAKFVCEDCNNEFFVPSSLFDVIGVLCDRCKSDKTSFVDFFEVSGDMKEEVIEQQKFFIDPEVLNEGDFYYWISPNFKDSYRLVQLVRLLDEEFCEVKLENEVFKTKRANLKIEKIEV